MPRVLIERMTLRVFIFFCSLRRLLYCSLRRSLYAPDVALYGSLRRLLYRSLRRSLSAPCVARTKGHPCKRFPLYPFCNFFFARREGSGGQAHRFFKRKERPHIMSRVKASPDFVALDMINVSNLQSTKCKLKNLPQKL